MVNWYDGWSGSGTITYGSNVVNFTYTADPETGSFPAGWTDTIIGSGFDSTGNPVNVVGIVDSGGFYGGAYGSLVFGGSSVETLLSEAEGAYRCAPATCEGSPAALSVADLKPSP